MITILLLIMLITVIVVCARYMFSAYKDIKEFEEFHKVDEELITNYQRLLKDIKEECIEALQVNDYKNCKEHYKIIKTLIENS